MHQGNWTCSGCGGSIKELPFEPKGEAGLLCRDCHSKQKGDSPKSAEGSGERKMYSGDWKCADCGTAITELPFEPRNTENLKCVDCFKKSKNP